MPIEFTCTQCQTVLRVDDRNRGKYARCPTCQALVTIPASSMASGFEPRGADRPGGGSAASGGAIPPTGSDRWLLRTSSGDLYGPVRFAELQQWWAENRIAPEFEVQAAGSVHWQPAGEFLGGAAAKPAAAGQVWVGSPEYREQDNSTLALILAAIGLFVFPLAVIALIIALVDLNGIKRGTLNPQCQGRVRTAMWLAVATGILGLAGSVLSCCGTCLPVLRG